MAQSSSMKQYGVRNMNCIIELMEWSNKMDLVAYSTDKGEIIVQRLNWQKIVTFPAPDENTKVRSISWQIDETVLAVGYSNGKVSLLDVESEIQISRLNYEEDITNVFFSKAISVTDYRCSLKHATKLSFDYFLPPLPSLNGVADSNNKKDLHKTFARGEPCFLVILLKSGKVNLLLLGSLKAGTIDLMLSVSNPDNFEVYDVRLSREFNSLYALLRDGQELKILHFHNDILQEYISPMLHMATQCSYLLETKNYINETLQCVLEAWETILLEMDNKLTKYANSQPEGALSADLLELLVFGYASNEIEEFLTEELTEKGVRKLANSVDLSYSTIQSLVTKPLQMAAINMFYFLDTTHGLSLMPYYFDDLICPNAAQQALRLCGTFLMKVLELQQIIDQFVYDMKLLFSWLCVVIVRLRQQDLTEDMKEISTQDAIYLAEYLNSFEDSVIVNEDGSVTKRKFNLEKIGQYLENKNLQQIAKPDTHDLWSKLLDDNECLRNSVLTFPHERQSSLIQQRDKLFAAVDNLFSKPNESLSSNFTLDASIHCCTLPLDASNESNKHFITSSFLVNETTKSDMFVTTINEQELLMLQFTKNCKTMKCLRIQLQPSPMTAYSLGETFQNLKFVCMQFYNEHVISLLLQSKTAAAGSLRQCYFVQCLLDDVKERASQHVWPNNVNLIDSAALSIFDIMDAGTFKALDGEYSLLAVSGSRKVASVLSDQQKKITIFEMEVDDDEDETEISHASILEMSKESNVSIIQND